MTLPALLLAAASVVETVLTLPTYPFADPDPVPATSAVRYPYFFFSDTTDRCVTQSWHAVVLENDRIRVTIMPQVGGKVWGAVDKLTGKDFIYYNHAVKFRNIAMRGPWCSGGIEFNFGVIGHGPWTATPVAHFIRENPDGSVSCFLSENEYITRTWWQVEVNVPATGDAFFTRTIWHNASGFPSPYYQWMNAAYSVSGDPQFVFPGRGYIEHWGEAQPWPRDSGGHDLSHYAENDFGADKSEHMICGNNGLFGIWWPQLNLGAAHLNYRADKYGRKLFLWALAPSGAIWDGLLNDGDGQYAELQSGRLFSQMVDRSSKTPFKHPPFAPGATDTFEEEWRVVRERAFFDRALADEASFVERPLLAPTNFSWNTAFGHYLAGEQKLRQKFDRAGEAELLKSLEIEPTFLPSIDLLATLAVRRGQYAKARELAATALSINTYDPEANYADGMAALAMGELTVAKERLGLAAYSPLYRAAADCALAKIELRERNWQMAAKLARRALAADAINPEALLSEIVAVRKAGDVAEARRLASAALVKLPLDHAIRFELNRVDAASEPFDRYLTNELPHETLMTIASWYEEAGLLDEAKELFARAAKTSLVAEIRLAALEGRAPDSSRPIAFAMPFRRESLPALSAAVARSDCWQFRYLYAVLLASFDRDQEADRLLDECGDRPDDAIFYLYRASRRSGEAALKDLRRAEQLHCSWRVGYALYENLGEADRWAEALAVIRRYREHSSANRINLAFANALVRNHLYDEAIEFMKTVVILPSEGGESATSSWVEAWRALAAAALEKGDRESAERAVASALSFPENLGSGRPYDFPENFVADWSDQLKEIAHRVFPSR